MKSDSTIVSASNDIALKLEVLAKEKESTRRKLVVTAKELALTAKEKESIRRKLVVTAKELAVTAKDKESTRRKLEVTAKQLAVTAKDKESTRRKLEVTAKEFAVTAKEKESIRRKLEVTAKEFAVTAKEKESIRRKLEITARQLAVTAKEKESTRQKLEVTARQLAVIAKEKESIRRKLVVTAKKLKKSHETLEKKVLNRTKDLEQIRAKNEAILTSIGDGLVVVDKEGKISYINKSFEEMLGWKTQEIIGKSMVEVVPREDQNGIEVSFEERILTQVLSGKKFVADLTNPFYYIRKDKSRFPTSSIVAPVVLNEKIVGAVEVFRDITKEKEIDKAKTEFVSLASHQLRTPLSTVSWYSEMLLSGDAGEVTSDQKKYLEEIYHGNSRMVELVNTLLDVSRIELGTFIVESKPTNIVKLIQSVIDEQKPQIEEKKIELSPLFEKRIPLMRADPKLLRMVIQNLLSNSVKYTHGGGKIEISLSLSGKKNVLLKISDTGYGIPKNQQDKIFTKLFRADNVIGKDTEGTGLGLYIAKSIVEQSGGKLWFESIENKGSTFSATLPLQEVKKK
ncbi:MAG: ATP-binding protein [bacterium]|nr:ATP-binding protein [bacterium]